MCSYFSYNMHVAPITICSKCLCAWNAKIKTQKRYLTVTVSTLIATLTVLHLSLVSVLLCLDSILLRHSTNCTIPNRISPCLYTYKNTLDMGCMFMTTNRVRIMLVFWFFVIRPSENGMFILINVFYHTWFGVYRQHGAHDAGDNVENDCYVWWYTQCDYQTALCVQFWANYVRILEMIILI
jgi:hypothetical protein